MPQCKYELDPMIGALLLVLNECVRIYKMSQRGEVDDEVGVNVSGAVQPIRDAMDALRIAKENDTTDGLGTRLASDLARAGTRTTS